MKAAIYSPYLDTFGGGERYMMTIAEILSQNNINVDVLLDQNLDMIGGQRLNDKLSQRFNLDLSRINFIKAPIGKGSSFLSRLFFLNRYQLLFYLTDGSIFLSSAKRNILHIQSPIIGQPAKSLWGKIKLRGWDLIIFNSKFTSEFSKNNWPLLSKVIYPPVDTLKIKPLQKEKFILSVGRFFGYLKDKKHEVMINVFRDLYQSKKINGWSLHLVGSASEGDVPYLNELKNKAKGLPIKFYPNMDYKDLINLYGQSSLYWHAAGFGEEDPTKMEHFGITTVEAMAAGCIPIVIGQGGQLEIVEDGKSGFVWQTLEEVKKYTCDLIENKKLRNNLLKESIKRSQRFDKQKFSEEIIDLLYRLN